MALTEAQKIEKVWEWYNNNADSSTGKLFYEETIPRASEVHSSEVFGQPIPSVPPTATAGVVKKFYPVAENGDGWIEMTVDRSVGGNKTWVALPTHNPNWSSGSADTSEILKGFISPKYGKQYLVKVFDGAGQEIPQLDSSDWTFDYSAGVLVFNSANRSESGSTGNDSIKIKVYQYIGKSAAQMIAASEAAGAGGRERIRGQLTGDKNGSNQTYYLPADCDTDAHYEVQVNGVGIEPSRDFNIGSDPLELNLVVALTTAETLDVIYYPKSHMITPKRITVTLTLNESGVIAKTQAVIPEIPAAGYPIHLYIGGQVVGLADVDIDGLTLVVEGDFAHLQWEIAYYVGREIKPKRVAIGATFKEATNQTQYTMPEIPHDDFPVSFFLGGQVVGLADYQVRNEQITIEGDWTHLTAEAEYYSHAGDAKTDMQAYLDALKKGLTEPTGHHTSRGEGTSRSPVSVVDVEKLTEHFGQLKPLPEITLPAMKPPELLIGRLDGYMLLLKGARLGT